MSNEPLTPWAAPTSSAWVVTEDHNPGGELVYTVVERRAGRAHRQIGSGLTEREAHRIAHSARTQAALETLLNPLMESEMPTDEQRKAAWDAWLASRGLSS